MEKFSEISLLRLWLRGSLAIFLTLFVWAYVPILIPFAVVVAALAGITFGIRLLTKRFERTDDP